MEDGCSPTTLPDARSSMLTEEARWLGQEIQALAPDRIYPQCDVGSSTAEFRERDQPWIDAYLFAPARRNGGRVMHADAKAAPGVDLVGDLTDGIFLASLRQFGFRSVVCANVLEHVADRAGMAAALLSLVPTGGYLFISCPYRFPLHPDPIDTAFRPSPEELAALFPGTRAISKAVIRGGSYARMLWQSPGRFFRRSREVAGPLNQGTAWRRVLHHLPWVVRRFEVSCVVLERCA